MESEKTFERPKSVLYQQAEKLYLSHPQLEEFLAAVQSFLREHANSVPKDQQREPKNIIESRLTSANDAFEAGILTCGTIATMTAEMARHVGFKVRLVHGESEESVDHAWIEAHNPESNQWEAYDLTRKERDVPTTHLKKAETLGSWFDIEETIRADAATLRERQKAKGLDLRED